MKIIKNEVEEIIVKLRYVYKKEHTDKRLNILLNYWCLFDEKEREIQELIEVSLETILCSKYYWCTQYKNRYNELYGKDIGIDQQQYKIIEEMAQRIKSVDWGVIQMIDEGKYN